MVLPRLSAFQNTFKMRKRRPKVFWSTTFGPYVGARLGLELQIGREEILCGQAELLRLRLYRGIGFVLILWYPPQVAE